MKDILYIIAFLLACASPVLLAVLILKLPIVARLRTKVNTDWSSYFMIVSAFVIIPCVLIFVVGPHITTFFPESRWAYATEYDTESQYVILEPKPHDCEFLKAPIGSKYCHFDRTVNTQAGDASVNHKTLVYVSWNKVPE